MRLITSLLALCLLVTPTLSFASEEPVITLSDQTVPAALGEAAAAASGQPEVSAPAQTAVAASAQQPATAKGTNIDLLLDRAMAQNLIAGGVVVIGNHQGILATAARGRLNDSAASPAIDDHTMFDIASLTKVIATAPAVMKLLDEGKVAVSDPVSKYLPEFAGHEDLTVFHLLTHTSGLEDVSAAGGIESTVRKAAAERSRGGSRFHYADINFILLGEIVHRVSGETLDTFCRNELFAPLGLQETMFLPPGNLAGIIAPTSGFVGGTVQDPNSRLLGGVAGHAGVFSSAYDLAQFARMLLGGGALDDKRILSEQTLARMTTPYFCSNGSVKRGLGWDMESGFSAPKGSFFSAASYGHTGYSGSSIWVDPQQDLFVVMLTRRLNYSDTRSFNQLRRNVSTMAAADMKLPGEDKGLAPSWDANGVNAQVLEAAYPALRSAGRTLAVSRSSKWQHQHQQRALRRSGRGQRVLAKAHSRHRSTHYRLAKAETRIHKKKRNLVKS